MSTNQRARAAKAASASSACYTRIETPLGTLLLVGERRARDIALCGIYFDGAPHAAHAVPVGAVADASAFEPVCAQLAAYFAGKRTTFELELLPRGTEFQRRVWAELRAIPYGATRSYADVARAIGKPKAVRAVGAANGKNPLSIVVPCHRVIGKNGTLTGYAGGIPSKQRLLELESARAGARR